MTEIKGTLHTCQCNDILKGSIATNAVKIRNNHNKNHWQISHLISKSSSHKEIKSKVNISSNITSIILVILLPPRHMTKFNRYAKNCGCICTNCGL